MDDLLGKFIKSKTLLKDMKGVLLESSIVSITDERGTILYANDKFCEISGYSREELIGKNHRVVKSDFHDDSFFKNLYETLLSGKEWSGEICNRAKNGDLYWVDTLINPVWDEEKEKFFFVSTRIVITHRKRFENVHIGMEKVASIGFWEWDINSDGLYWSDMIYEIHGLDKNEFTPCVEKGIEQYSIEHRPVITACIENALKTGEGWDVELQILKGKDKVPNWVRAVGEVEFVAGKPFRVHGTFQDINNRKLDRIDLEKSKAKLNMALDVAGVGNWTYYPKTDELVWDETMHGVYGVAKEKEPKNFESWVKCLHPSDTEQAIEKFEETLQRGDSIFDSEFRIIHGELGTRTIRAKAFIEYNEVGEPIEIVGLNWDISKEVNYQETLIKARKNALEATQAKSAFLASMSHEIRTPMNGMMGMLELLAESKLNSKQEELVEIIQDCGDQLLNIVNDILDFSKIEAGKLELEYRQFDPRKVMKGVISIFDAQASRKGLKLNCFIDNSVPKFLLGDETRLKQILTNLVSNAMKFTEEGSITLEIIQDKKRSSSNQGIFIFKVKDTGLGIPLDKQGRLFQSFRQVDESTTREFGGTGLGLAICRSLVERMGGHIGVESAPGEGALFYFEVMAGIQNEDAVKKVEETIVDSSFRKNINVLLAEDNATNQKLALSFLKRLEVSGNVLVANNGQEAVDYFEGVDHKIDVILMDVQMPIKDGLTATREIKAKLGDKAPIIVAMTANAFDEDKKNCLEAGMDYFVPKPVKRKALEEVLCQAFPEGNTIKEETEKVVNMTNPTFNSIDTQKILFEFEEDFDIFEELIQDYKEQVPEFLSSLKTAIEGKDSENLKITAHTLKGIVGNFYCDELKQAAFVMEEAGKNGTFDNLETAYSNFESLNEKILKELDAFTKAFNAGELKAA